MAKKIIKTGRPITIADLFTAMSGMKASDKLFVGTAEDLHIVERVDLITDVVGPKGLKGTILQITKIEEK